ncbi:c3.2 [Tranosema rostrale ichnovirus]|nr:c3.2 [Tranosema rostrale ichnovirus]
MHSRKRGKWRAPPPPFFTSERISLPLKTIVCMSKFLCFVDYQNFIRSLWPTGNYSDIIEATLWQKSTYKYTTKFINGKRMEITYNFNPSRSEKDRIRINLDSLRPVFGGLVPPAMHKFTNVSKLENFITVHVHLNMCSNRRFASCPCHLINANNEVCEEFVKPAIDACSHGHFHHYCSDHVETWLKILENTLICRQELGELFSEDIAEMSLLSVDDIVYLQGEPMRRCGGLLFKLV